MLNHYAIGFGDWVEIRKAVRPPKMVVSEVDRVGEVREFIPGSSSSDSYLYPFGYGNYVKVKKNFKLKSIIHLGGRVVCSIKLSKFHSLSGLHVSKHAVITIPVSTVKRVLEWKGV